jgi:hypothetical protein
MTNTVTAPRQYGNPYFDAMECPIESLPKNFTVGIKRFSLNCPTETITLPTSECFQPGNFVARAYAGISVRLVEAALNKRGIVFYSTVWRKEDGINIVPPKY